MFRVIYDAPNGPRSYTVDPMDRPTAEHWLAEFKRRYENPDGTPKAYPNGRGHYPLANPRIMPA